jgi:sugar (pentulose or hexulose) kinase
MVAVCLDVGTSMIKAVAFDEQGIERALVRRSTDVLRPERGFAEQDMNAVWEAVGSSVQEVTEQLDEEVELLAFTGPSQCGAAVATRARAQARAARAPEHVLRRLDLPVPDRRVRHRRVRCLGTAARYP